MSNFDISQTFNDEQCVANVWVAVKLLYIIPGSYLRKTSSIVVAEVPKEDTPSFSICSSNSKNNLSNLVLWSKGSR